MYLLYKILTIPYIDEINKDIFLYCIYFTKQRDNTNMKKIILFSLLFVALVIGSPPASAANNYYTVQKGDSMWIIAKKLNVSFAKILELNKHFLNQHLIHPNDKIMLPAEGTGSATAENSNSDKIQSGNNAAPAESSVSQQAQQVLQLVNEERKKQGLKSLKLSSKLTSIANVKAADMAKNNYLSHTSPTYGTPFQMLQHFGVSYRSAGENIAAGQKSPQEVMQAWMNSSGHRANILNSSYTELGVGYYAGGSYKTEWVQLFTGN